MFISTSTCKNILKRNFTKAAIIILTHFLIMQPKYISKYYLFLIISHGRETHCRYRYSTHKSAFMRKVLRGNTTPRRTTKLHKVTGPECRAEHGPQSVASGLHISPGLLSVCRRSRSWQVAVSMCPGVARLLVDRHRSCITGPSGAAHNAM